MAESSFDFSTFPILETPRLLLRQFEPADAAAFYDFASDPIGQQYDSDPPLADVVQAAAIIKDFEANFAARKSINWAVCWKAESRLVGNMGLYFPEGVYYKTDLGYTVARPYWQRGIATEAVRALLRFAFESLRVHRVNVDTRIDNIASMRLMERLGFRHEGTRRECIRGAKGEWQSWALYGLLEEEYWRMAVKRQGMNWYQE